MKLQRLSDDRVMLVGDQEGPSVRLLEPRVPVILDETRQAILYTGVLEALKGRPINEKLLARFVFDEQKQMWVMNGPGHTSVSFPPDFKHLANDTLGKLKGADLASHWKFYANTGGDPRRCVSVHGSQGFPPRRYKIQIIPSPRGEDGEITGYNPDSPLVFGREIEGAVDSVMRHYKNPFVSAAHFSAGLNAEGEMAVADLGSKNGTFLYIPPSSTDPSEEPQNGMLTVEFTPSALSAFLRDKLNKILREADLPTL